MKTSNNLARSAHSSVVVLFFRYPYFLLQILGVRVLFTTYVYIRIHVEWRGMPHANTEQLLFENTTRIPNAPHRYVYKEYRRLYICET